MGTSFIFTPLILKNHFCFFLFPGEIFSFSLPIDFWSSPWPKIFCLNLIWAYFFWVFYLGLFLEKRIYNSSYHRVQEHWPGRNELRPRGVISKKLETAREEHLFQISVRIHLVGVLVILKEYKEARGKKQKTPPTHHSEIKT